MGKEKDLKADEIIGVVINECGEIIRNPESEEIQFSAPIFTPPQENTVDTPQVEEVSVSFRTISDTKKSNKTTGTQIAGVSRLELEQLKEEMQR